MNTGHIIKIALEIRNLIQKELDEKDSSDGEDNEKDETSMKHRNQLIDWQKFCSDHLDGIERIWNKKLEDIDEDIEDRTTNDEDLEEETNTFMDYITSLPSLSEASTNCKEAVEMSTKS